MSENDNLQKLAELLTVRPDQTYEQLSRRLQEARHRFHAYTAEVLAGPLNTRARELPRSTAPEKQAIARWLNGELRAHGLAVVDPKSGEPAVLHVDPCQGAGRFQIELVERSRGTRRVMSSTELPTVRLCAHPPRREPLLEYWSTRGDEQGEEPRSR